MAFSIFRRSCCWLLVGSFAIGGGISCRKRSPKVEVKADVIAPELLANQMRNLEGPLYQSQSKSAIHWQSWTPETLARAKEANRLVFAVIALPQQRGFDQVLRLFESDPSLVKALNDHYVPILIDGDATREMGILTAQLCVEIRQSLELPLLLWMTHEGNPVAWIPVSERQGKGALTLFNQSDAMVRRMWNEDSNYVLKNSRSDNEARKKRLVEKPEGPAYSENPGDDSLQAARQLVSLYDAYSRTLDEAGGLIPVGVLEALTTSAILPGVPDSLRKRSLETTQELLKDLLPSAMFDPLEGGVFSGRVSQSWALPNFTWDCMNQARMAAVLFRAHTLTGDAIALERARGLIAFAEKKFQNEEGLFAETSLTQGEGWLWTAEAIEKALPAEDAKWWMAATGVKAMGNLPSEADPQRLLFRSNSLAIVRPLSATAAQLGVSVDDFTKRFEQSRAKLLEVRKGLVKEPFVDRSPHAGANFRMISAYSNAYAATGEQVFREKAAALLAKAKAKFYADRRLNNYGEVSALSLTAGRAFLYALAIQAAQDFADISSDPEAYHWVEELAKSAEEQFMVEGQFEEVSKDARLVDLSIIDKKKIFDDTSGGIFWQARVRRPVQDSALNGLTPKLSIDAPRVPILYTDVILAVLIQTHGKSVMIGKNLSPELKSAVERLPLQVIPRYPAKDSDGVPDGSVRVISPDGTGTNLSDASKLREEFQLLNKTPEL